MQTNLLFNFIPTKNPLFMRKVFYQMIRYNLLRKIVLYIPFSYMDYLLNMFDTKLENPTKKLNQ